MLPPVTVRFALFDGMKHGGGLCKKNERNSTIAAQLKPNIEPAQPAPAQPCRPTVTSPRPHCQAQHRLRELPCA
jgi:hypothetical protein